MREGFSAELLTSIKEQTASGQNRSAVAGQVFSIGLMMGMSRILGDLLLKTAMLKSHLWYSDYYSPKIETCFSYILFLEENPLV
jgi:hypothetical protein